MLYATDGIDSEADLAKPMIGVANVWYVFLPSLSFLNGVEKKKVGN